MGKDTTTTERGEIPMNNSDKMSRQRKASEEWGRLEAQSRGYKLGKTDKKYITQQQECFARKDTDRSINRRELDDNEPNSAPIWHE